MDNFLVTVLYLSFDLINYVNQHFAIILIWSFSIVATFILRSYKGYPAFDYVLLVLALGPFSLVRALFLKPIHPKATTKNQSTAYNDEICPRCGQHKVSWKQVCINCENQL